MRKFALTGHPLGHSMSPPIHKALFALSGEPDVAYDLMEILPEEFDQKAPALLKLDGFNITIPYKIPIIRHLNRLSDGAKRYGSVNVVKCGTESIGFNTDVDGFLRSVASLGVSLPGSRVLLVGCGGVGRMMAIETALAGAKLTIGVLPPDLPAARSAAEAAAAIKPDAEVDICEIAKLSDIPGQWDLLVNATPVGMFPKTDACAVGDAVIRRAAAVFDAVYNPEQTKLMALAAAEGARVQGGMAMLVWQAVAAHEIWDGAVYAPQDIESLIADMHAQMRRIFS